MRPLLVIVLVIACFTLSSCSPRQSAVPPPTPHPASDSMQRAIQLYPELAKKGSLFNRTFVDLVEQRKVQDPRSLSYATWPLQFAEDTARMIGVQQSRASASAATPKTLERGSYGKTRALSSRPIYVDQNGAPVSTR